MHRLMLLSKGMLSAAIVWLISAMLVSPALAAERIVFSLHFFETYLSISDLEEYAETGRVSDELDFYLRRIDPQEEWLRNALLKRYRLPLYLSDSRCQEHVIISRFLYSPLGEMLLNYAGTVVTTQSRNSGFFAIRSSLILASSDSEGLTIINILKHFPGKSIRLNVKQIEQTFEDLAKLGEIQIPVTSNVDEFTASIHLSQLQVPQVLDSGYCEIGP